MHLFKGSTPKKDIERSQPYYEWLNKNIRELIQDYKKELKSKLSNYPAEADDPKNKFLRQHPIGCLFFEIKIAAENSLLKDIDAPFDFQPTFKLIQACNSDDAHFSKAIKTKLLKVCRIQFFIVLIRKIDFVLESLRTDTTLNVTTNDQGHEIDPLGSHILGQHLLPIRSVCVNGYLHNEVSSFNVESLLNLYRTCQEGNFSKKIKDTISHIYHIVINDFKTPSSLLGNHFTYENLNIVLAVELISDLLKQEKSSEDLHKKEEPDDKRLNKPHDKKSDLTPEGNKSSNQQNGNTLILSVPKINYGESLWRIFLLLTPEQLKILIVNHASLISEMRQSVSFQAYELLKDNNQMLFKRILQFPWIFQFFTARQMISFIYSPLSAENREILIQQNLQFKTTSNSSDIGYSGKRLFISKIHLQGKNPLQFATLIPEENTKKMLLTFLAIHSANTKKIINEVVTYREFIFTVGIYRELMPLLDPRTVINLFLEVDRYLPITIPEALSSNLDITQNENSSDIKITGNILRDFIEYELLLEHILEDIKQGDKSYFEALLKIPYLLYELVKRETIGGKNGFLQLPVQNLLPFFVIFDVKIILDTLRLLDTQDPINNFMTINDTKYSVDKNDTLPAFQRFAQFLMSAGFLDLRKSWFQSDDTIFREYPFLLKDFDSRNIDNFINGDPADLIDYAELCLKNGVNTFICCPQLLVYLTPEKIVELHHKSSLAELLRIKEMPKTIVDYFDQKMSQLKEKIPGLEQYINQQKQIAELDSLLTPLPATQSDQSKSNKALLRQRSQQLISLDEALADLESDAQQQKERQIKADEQARREQQRKIEREEFEHKLKQEEEAHRNNLAEIESKLELLRNDQKSKQEELATLQLVFADKKERLEEEIARERQHWEAEIARMQQEKETLQKQFEEEAVRRNAEKEESARTVAELSRMIIEEQERLLKESVQRARELEELLKKQEEERMTNEQLLKKLEEAHRLKIAENERAQNEIMERDFANKQEKLEQLKKQREAEIKRREEELERLRMEQEKQKTYMAEELRKRESEERERQERAQQDARRREETMAELERRELEITKLFQQEEENRRRQLATLEEKQQRAYDQHILNQDRNQKAIREILERNRKQEEERAELERQATDLASAKQEMEEFRKRLKEEETIINREKEELQHRAEINKKKKRELDEAYRVQDQESDNLDKLDAELKLLKIGQQELRQQLDEQLAHNKQLEAKYKKHLEESEHTVKQLEEEFQRKVADNKRRHEELESAYRACELENQQLEAARLRQEKEHQTKLEENERKRQAEAEQYTKRMAQLEAERQQQGSAKEQLEAMQSEIDRVKKEREQELARQQLELEQLQQEEAKRKKQLAEEQQRKQHEQAKQRRSVDAYSREAKELEEAHLKALQEVQRKRQEAEGELKSQSDKLKEEKMRFDREAEEFYRKQKALVEAQQKQAKERAALKQKEEELAREEKKDAELKRKLAEQENKLILERQQRAAEQERKRKEQEEARKKEEERKTQEERRNVFSLEQEERLRKIEAERAQLAKSDKNYRNRQQELAAQSVRPASPSPTRAAIIPTSVIAVGSPNTAVRVVSPKIPSSDAKNASVVGIFPQPSSSGSPRNGMNSAKEETSQIPAGIPKQRDDGRSRSAKVFEPKTVEGALSTFIREEQSTKEAPAIAAAITKTPPPSPKGKGL